MINMVDKVNLDDLDEYNLGIFPFDVICSFLLELKGNMDSSVLDEEMCLHKVNTTLLVPHDDLPDDYLLTVMLVEIGYAHIPCLEDKYFGLIGKGLDVNYFSPVYKAVGLHCYFGLVAHHIG